MRVFHMLVLAVLAFASTAIAQLDFPKCGQGCLFGPKSPLPQTECKSFTNSTCLCNNEDAITLVGACVKEACSIRDALAMQKFSDVTCKRPVVDNSVPAQVTPIIFGAMAVVFFFLRVAARWNTGIRVSWRADDWAIVPPFLAMVALIIVSEYLSFGGLGFDMWMIPHDQITWILHLFWWGELLYIFIIPATKISILIFYLQIFPEKFYKRASWTLIILNVLYIISFIVTTVFQCTPIEGAWLTWDGEFEAECRSLNKQVWAAAITSILLDVFMLVLPLPALWKLNMRLRKKLQVMFMFSLGLFVTIVSVLRLQYVAGFATTTNATQDLVPAGTWSVVECCVGIICACLPSVRSILSTILPKVFGTTVGSSNPGKSGDYNSKSGTGTGGGSAIRAKSEFVMQSKQSKQSRRTLDPLDVDEDSSIELIMHSPEAGTNGARVGRNEDKDTEMRFHEIDIEAGGAAVENHRFSGDQHRHGHPLQSLPLPPQARMRP